MNWNGITHGDIIWKKEDEDIQPMTIHLRPEGLHGDGVGVLYPLGEAGEGLEIYLREIAMTPDQGIRPDYLYFHDNIREQVLAGLAPAAPAYHSENSKRSVRKARKAGAVGRRKIKSTKKKRSKKKKLKKKRSTEKNISAGKVKKKTKKVRMSPKKFSKFLLDKEKEYWKEMQECQKSCNKIKTNWAKDKKKLKVKGDCLKKCNDERLIKIRKVHKQYPKEFKVLLGKYEAEDAANLKKAQKEIRAPLVKSRLKGKVKKGGGKKKTKHNKKLQKKVLVITKELKKCEKKCKQKQKTNRKECMKEYKGYIQGFNEKFWKSKKKGASSFHISKKKAEKMFDKDYVNYCGSRCLQEEGIIPKQKGGKKKWTPIKVKSGKTNDS